MTYISKGLEDTLTISKTEEKCAQNFLLPHKEEKGNTTLSGNLKFSKYAQAATGKHFF